MPDKEEAQRIVAPLLARSERVLWTSRPEVGSVFWKALRGALGFVAAILYFFYAEAVVRIAECVQAQPEVRVGVLHGFAVTLGLTVTPTLFGHPSRQDAEARVKLAVLSHDARQYRFALAWLCALPAMKEPLEQIVRSFRIDDA